MDIKLTQYSSGAGCGCKISQKVLSEILANHRHDTDNNLLIVGNSKSDDAAVFDLGDGTGIVSTTDFFMPIVDDAFTFGKIASINAISDIYAMGGTPLMAIAVLAWPINKISPEIAGIVIEGAKSACEEARIPLAGGHSIDAPEPIFGLAVTGRVPLNNIKRNSTAKAGDLLYLTKPLGVGILTTAVKKSLLKEEHKGLAESSMCKLNSIGEELGKLNYVHAMTDVTGFGLLGHLSEICEGSGLSAEINLKNVPLLDKKALDYYIEKNSIPGGTNRNFESLKEKISEISDYEKAVLLDPQTSGGLLVAIDENSQDEFELFLKNHGVNELSIGRMLEGKEEKLISLV